MCEEVRAIRNLPQILKTGAGIGLVLIGEGEPVPGSRASRQYDHPTVASAIDEIWVFQGAQRFCGHPHVDSKNVERFWQRDFAG